MSFWTRHHIFEKNSIVLIAGILVVADLTPMQAALLDPTAVLAIVMAAGSPVSHGAILARAAVRRLRSAASTPRIALAWITLANSSRMIA